MFELVPVTAFLGYSFSAAAAATDDHAGIEAAFVSCQDAVSSGGSEAEGANIARAACVSFGGEWRRLSSEQRQLLSDLALRLRRPLRLPLLQELQQAGGESGGFGPSLLRYTPRHEFGAEGGVVVEWRERPLRNKQTGKFDMFRWRVHAVAPPRVDAAAAGGVPPPPRDWLCYYCNGPRDEASGWCERGAPFCSSVCVDNWAVQVGAGNAPRALLFERERGVCRACTTDCHSIYLRLRPLDARRRRRLLRSYLPGLTTRRRERIVRYCFEGDLWQADHMLAVQNGGGESGIDNLQTLCVPCHLKKTAHDRAAAGEVRGATVLAKRRRLTGEGSSSAALVGAAASADIRREYLCRLCRQPKKGHRCPGTAD
uniref:HNH domain-containing protein n=1 Tax=Haptolina ericina TaxID=156174 RepID=A0A7S3AJJ9_9EUKA